MSFSKPLTYESQKSVLQHMEANLRIKFAQRSPSIRTVEKATPLKLDDLYVEPTLLQVNKTTYHMESLLTSEDDDLLELFKGCDGTARGHYDVDTYGVPDYSIEKLVFPGDIDITEEGQGRRVGLEAHEEDLRNLFIQNGLEQPPEGHQPVINVLLVDDPDGKHMTRNINHQQKLVLSLRLREENGPSPFKNYLQCTITEGETKNMEYMEYEKKLPEAMKYLMNKFFGQRREVIHVGEFSEPIERGVLRFPEGALFKIQNLGTGHNVQKVLEGLNPIFDPSSFPLKSICLYDMSHSIEDTQHPVTKAAEKFILINDTHGHTWLEVFQSMPNRELQWLEGSPTSGEMLNFIQHWIENVRSIGKSFTCCIPSEEFGQEILPLVKELPNAKLVNLDIPICEKFPHCISIPINENSELNIFGKATENANAFWDFKMEVMPRGTAQSLDH